MDTIFKYKDYEFIDNDRFKIIHSKDFNYFFNKETGESEKWGRTKNNEDDPIHSDLGPIDVDLELCKDVNNNDLDKYKGEILLEGKQCLGKCPWCYKCNGVYKYTHVMTFIKYKEALLKLCNTHVRIENQLYYCFDEISYKGKKIRAIDYPELDFEHDICNCTPLTQVALVNTNLTTNVELLRICEFTRQMGVVPDITCHAKDDLSDEFLMRLCSLCGNVAVSIYDKEKTYNLIQRLHYCGARQSDIDLFLSDETFQTAINTCKDFLTDGRLKYLNSIIFLLLKQQGRGKNFHKITDEHYKELLDFAINNHIIFSTDPCQYNRIRNYYLKYKNNEIKEFDVNFEKCDANRFSCYINTLGDYYPCPFMEGQSKWIDPPNIFKCHNFINECWNGQKSDMFNIEMLTNNFECPTYDL